MIRRHVHDEFWLIRQADHAAVAGELARHLGNAKFQRPERLDEWVHAVALHDAGWPLHDDRPILDSRRRPLDVFDAPPHVALPIWKASADAAERAGNFAGLLVSLHGLHLSAHLAAKATPAERDDPHAKFNLNKFQHAEFERQETLRPRLGLSNDRPLRLGLAEPRSEARADPAERSLLHAFRLLQAMDAISLALCCTAVPFPLLKPVFTSSDLRHAPLNVRRTRDGSVAVEPFPFDARATVEIPFRRVKASAFESDEALQQQYAAAPDERFDVRVVPG